MKYLSETLMVPKCIPKILSQKEVQSTPNKRQIVNTYDRYWCAEQVSGFDLGCLLECLGKCNGSRNLLAYLSRSSGYGYTLNM